MAIDDEISDLEKRLNEEMEKLKNIRGQADEAKRQADQLRQEVGDPGPDYSIGGF